MSDGDVRELVDAVQDLTRITLALNGTFGSKAEAIRRLDEMGIPAARIANLLGMSTKDVSSSLIKARKSNQEGNHLGE